MLPLQFSARNLKLEKTLAFQFASRVRHEGLVKGDAGVKGFGVFTTRSFQKGEYLCEYEGKLTVSKQRDHTEGIYVLHYKVGKLFYRLLFFLVIQFTISRSKCTF